MPNLLTTKQVAEYFGVSPRTVTQKFIKQGLKVIPIGTKDYRFKQEDVEEFAEHLKELAQEKIIQQNPIPFKRKTKCKTINVDFEKIRINRELNRVV